MRLPLGWSTDLAVLRIGGSVIEEHPDHLVVRSPQNPTYHWGHFVLVTDAGAVEDADRWTTRFLECFPGATHRAIGLITSPAQPGAWLDAGLAVENDEVLVAREPVQPRPLPDGYRVRPLTTAEDWRRSTVLNDTCYPGEQEFQERTTAVRAEMAARGDITWFGAFSDAGDLAAELGILDCGDGVARFQSVLTAPAHRRRGLVGHLLGVADAYARSTGARSTVIIADEGADAARLYRSVGLLDDSRKTEAYRFTTAG